MNKVLFKDGTFLICNHIDAYYYQMDEDYLETYIATEEEIRAWRKTYGTTYGD